MGLDSGVTPETAKVLVVGAGGIGCELLKNLVDLDVIELSNLNRQFLFRRQHIGQAKAKVAAEAVKSMVPDANITPYWANIKDTTQFPFSFFRTFDVVLNALDNLDARRYVNNMCLSASVPLVESGTSGYLGQCSVILPCDSECFDCTPKEKPKTFPVCTIRTTPSSLVHCIVWAKEYLMTNLLGPPTEDALPEDEALLESLKRETEAFVAIRDMGHANSVLYSRKVFSKVFFDDITSLVSLTELWENRDPPTPLSIDFDSVEEFDMRQADDHQIWTLSSWIAVFRSSIEILCKRAFANNSFTEIYFDKDDEDVMSFVAAAANIRAHIFGIPLASHFSLKSMAGNIIPAIATTNAIVAGMIVLQALNILNREKARCVTAFLTYGVRRGTLFACERYLPPNQDCATCQVDRAIASLDPTKTTLGLFLDSITDAYNSIRGVNIAKRECTVLEGTRMLYDEDFADNAERLLSELDCGDSRFIRVDFWDANVPLLVVIDKSDKVQFSFTSERQNRKRKHMAEDIGKDTNDDLSKEVNDDIDEDITQPPTKMARLLIADEDVVVV
ncbi:hypothetical protein PSACC_02703 [Paramicrosporidium saccamoebae]|uniref:Ubiquitin-activating enzyme E1-like n=1 Tax=Paramicrosporidium saccamoebae TaxID=1246581 RepID=A0A2H9TIA8_9FUNG|nr:hypothetical protein PSACC_02703 [Paramicrosporidium saccamoebae]